MARFAESPLLNEPFLTDSNHLDCAVILSLVLVGVISVGERPLTSAVQMLRTAFQTAVLTVLYTEKLNFTQDLRSSGIEEGSGVFGDSLMDEFMTLLLLVVACLQVAGCCDMVSASEACLANGVAVSLATTSILPMGAPSILPNHSVQLLWSAPLDARRSTRCGPQHHKYLLLDSTC